MNRGGKKCASRVEDDVRQEKVFLQVFTHLHQELGMLPHLHWDKTSLIYYPTGIIYDLSWHGKRGELRPESCPTSVANSHMPHIYPGKAKGCAHGYCRMSQKVCPWHKGKCPFIYTYSMEAGVIPKLKGKWL